MKELIERLRFQQRYTRGQVPVTMQEAADALEQQAAVIEQMREALGDAHDACLDGMHDTARAIAVNVLALYPCPEVLNKMRADAVAKFAQDAGLNQQWVEDYICHIEDGEA